MNTLLLIESNNSEEKRYDMIKFISCGSYSETYLYKRNNEYVIMKYIYPIKHTNMHTNSEVFILQRLIKNDGTLHPNIQKFIINFQINNTHVYYNELYYKLIKTISKKKSTKLIIGNPINVICTEYIDGPNLDIYINYLHSNKNISFIDSIRVIESLAYTFIEQMLSAIKYIHEKSIAHRDIKPENIMYKMNENKFIIIDFGLSIYQNTTHFGGSDKYIYPKIKKLRRNEQEISFELYQATDIYALGLCLYLLVNGVLPFHNDQYRKSAFNSNLINIMIEKLIFNPEEKIVNILNFWNSIK